MVKRKSVSLLFCHTTYTCGLKNSTKILLVHKEMIFHGLVLIGVVPDLQQWQNLVKLIINLVIQ